MARALAPEHARPEDLAPAFQLIFRQVPAPDREARVVNALYLVEQGELQREGVLVVRRRREMLGALVCVPLRGASGLVWPPQAVDGPRRAEVEDRLVQCASAWLHRRGAKLAQALLPPEEAFLAAPLLRNGFTHITTLNYMKHDLTLAATEDDPGTERFEPYLTFLPYRAGAMGRFHQTLLRTYEHTRDCPELNGVRNIAEIIDGHKAQGFHDPDHWWLAEASGQALGVLMLADMPELGGWDLAYLGVVPEARGRGVGRALTQKALREARAAAVQEVTLAVDARNRPAWNLYRQLGFEATAQRDVYLAFY
jgi:ribosomal protein S18 acetylase RimI-like enzyme